MELEGIDHVGIAVDEGALATARWILEDVMGADAPTEETVEDQGARTLIYRLGGAKIELVVPLSGEGPLAKFLERQGPGMHHLALEVEDVASAIERVDAEGITLVDEEPRPGVEGSRIAFLHPKDTFGTLLELVELPGDSNG